MAPKPSRRHLRRDSFGDDNEAEASTSMDRSSSPVASPNMGITELAVQIENENLKRSIMMADLSTATADRIKSDDFGHKPHPQDLRRLLNDRKVNDSGSKEHQAFMKNKGQVSAWSNFGNTVDAVHGEEINDTLLNGQSHRTAMQLRLEQERMKYGEDFNPDEEYGHGGRGGRAGRGGLGGGAVSTRGRGAPYRGSLTSMTNLPAKPASPSKYRPLDPAVEREDYGYSGGKKKATYRGSSSAGRGGGFVGRSSGHHLAQCTRGQIANGATRVSADMGHNVMQSPHKAFAAKMMDKMGHIPGQGLGPSGQGMVEPFQVRVLKPRAGLGIPIGVSKSKKAKKKRKSKAKSKPSTAAPSGSLHPVAALPQVPNMIDDTDAFLKAFENIRNPTKPPATQPKTGVELPQPIERVLSTRAQADATLPDKNESFNTLMASSSSIKAGSVHMRPGLPSDITFPPLHMGDTVSWTDGRLTPVSKAFETSPELGTQSSSLETDGEVAGTTAAPQTHASSRVGLGINHVPQTSTPLLIEDETAVSEDYRPMICRKEKPIDLMDIDNETVSQPSIPPTQGDNPYSLVVNGIRYVREDKPKQLEGQLASPRTKPLLVDGALTDFTSSINMKASNQDSILGNHNLPRHHDIIRPRTSPLTSMWSQRVVDQMKSHLQGGSSSLTPKLTSQTSSARSPIASESSDIQGRNHNIANSLWSSSRANATVSAKLGSTISHALNSLSLGSRGEKVTVLQSSENQATTVQPANPFGEFSAFVVNSGDEKLSAVSHEFGQRSRKVTLTLTSEEVVDTCQKLPETRGLQLNSAVTLTMKQDDLDKINLGNKRNSDGKANSGNLSESKWGKPEAVLVTSRGVPGSIHGTVRQATPHVPIDVSNPFAAKKDEKLPKNEDNNMTGAVPTSASNKLSFRAELNGNDVKAATLPKRSTNTEETLDQKLARIMNVTDSKQFMTPFSAPAAEDDRGRSPGAVATSVRSNSQASTMKLGANLSTSLWAAAGDLVVTRVVSPPQKKGVSAVSAENAPQQGRGRVGLVNYDSDDSEL